MDRLYGRGKVVNFVKDALKCKDIRDRPLPILLLTGPRGSGGSALLTRLWEEIEDDCPCARLDLADAENVSTVLLVAMHGLLRKVTGVDRLSFPRLRLAVKALSFVGGADDRAVFDAYMRAGKSAAIASSRLAEWMDLAASLLQSPDRQIAAKLGARLLDEVLSGLDRRRDRAVLRWFTERGDATGGSGSGLDELWRLYLGLQAQDEGERDRVDGALCDALLTDMRTDYNDTGLRHARRTRNPVLLLDNADSPAGERLLGLIEERRRKSGLGGEPADPLLIVPVQRHPPPTRNAGTPVGAAERNLDFEGWRTTTAEDEHLTLWCPVRLSALGYNDVVEMTTSRLLGRTHRDADFIRSLTGGHPGATGQLSKLLTMLDSPDDLPLLLYQPIPEDLRDQGKAGAGITVGDHLLRHAFTDDLRTLPDGGIDPDNNPMLNAMAAGAATPGFPLGACQAALDYWGREAVTAGDARYQLIETMWWAEPGDGEPGGLHPLAALLLRHWLARDPDKWAGVHEGYVTHYSSDPANAALRYRHKLAQVVPDARLMDAEPETNGASTTSSRLGELFQVVTFLAGKWELGLGREAAPPGQDVESARHRTQAWLDVLDTVVSAPTRVRTSHRPETLVWELASPTEPGSLHEVISKLTVARWLLNDRLFDPTRQLARVVADAYYSLAEFGGGDKDLLLEEAARYRKIEHEWRD